MKSRKILSLLLTLVLAISTIAALYHLRYLLTNVESLASKFLISLLVAGFFYIISHIFRCIRLLLLLDDKKIRLRYLIYVQFSANIVNLLIPFRIGELLRIIGFNQLNKNIYKTSSTIFIERTFDFFWLFFFLLMLTISTGISSPQQNLIIQIALTFFFSFYLIFFILPQVLHVLSIYIVKAYTTPEAIFALKLSKKLSNALGFVSYTYKKRLPLLIFLTTLIWVSEIVVFGVLFYESANLSSIIYLSFSTFLSFILTDSDNMTLPLETASSRLKEIELSSPFEYGHVIFFWAYFAISSISLFFILKKLGISLWKQTKSSSI